jgi:hypothetical protein
MKCWDWDTDLAVELKKRVDEEDDFVSSAQQNQIAEKNQSLE